MDRIPGKIYQPGKKYQKSKLMKEYPAICRKTEMAWILLNIFIYHNHFVIWQQMQFNKA